MAPSQYITIVASFRNGQTGTLLRWRQGTRPGRKSSAWFVDQAEALIVRDAMREGRTFTDAIRQLHAGVTADDRGVDDGDAQTRWQQERDILRQLLAHLGGVAACVQAHNTPEYLAYLTETLDGIDEYLTTGAVTMPARLEEPRPCGSE